MQLFEKTIEQSKARLAEAFEKLERIIEKRTYSNSLSAEGNSMSEGDYQRLNNLEAKFQELQELHRQLVAEHDEVRHTNEEVARVLAQSIEQLDKLIVAESCQ